MTTLNRNNVESGMSDKSPEFRNVVLAGMTSVRRAADPIRKWRIDAPSDQQVGTALNRGRVRRCYQQQPAGLSNRRASLTTRAR